MKAAVLLSFLWLMAGMAAFGGSEQIIKQRAKDLRDQNNARQGVAPPQPGRAPVQTAPAVQAATPQQVAFARLQTDVEPIKAGAEVTSQQKQKLAADLAALVQGSTKPSAASTAKLADELAHGLIAKPMPASQRTRLLQDLNSALNSSAMSEAQMQAVISKIRAAFQSSGLGAQQVTRISEALEAVIAETRKTSRS